MDRTNGDVCLDPKTRSRVPWLSSIFLYEPTLNIPLAPGLNDLVNPVIELSGSRCANVDSSFLLSSTTPGIRKIRKVRLQSHMTFGTGRSTADQQGSLCFKSYSLRGAFRAAGRTIKKNVGCHLSTGSWDGMAVLRLTRLHMTGTGWSRSARFSASSSCYARAFAL